MSRFSPSAAEVALVNQIFAQADTQKIGVITGEAAVKIFSGSKLSPSILAEIWTIADDDNNGVLTRKGVAVAIRLLGHAQRGEQVTEALANKPGPVPIIEGLNAPIGQQSTGVPSTKSPPPGLPPLTPQDKAKFMKLFLGCGPVNGILNGEKARDVLVKSKLPVDKLSQIWNLADTKNRGALDASDFTLAMYLIQASMSGQLQAIPSVLPAWLHEQAGAKGGLDSVTSHATGESGSFSPTGLSGFSGRPVSTILPQYTGQALQPQATGQALRAISPPLPARSVFGGASPAFPLAPQTTGQAAQWDVSPTEKANADRLFNSLDTQKKGYIEGDVAVPFMLQSKLSDDILAQVWDLSDLNNDGRLTRDGFAVAMHLIQAKLAGKDIPVSLPSSLVPLSMRTNGAIAVPSQPPVSESIRDLLWDDTPPSSATTSQPPAPTIPRPATGTISPQHTAFTPNTQRTTIFGDPFANSPFGITSPATVHKDLLGDDDEQVHSSPPLQDKSAEIGNTQNQLNSTNRSLETARSERQNLERTLAEQAAQLSALQTQLSSAKAAYETETRLLSSLRERYATQMADIQKSREELIHAESDLSAVRVEKTEVEGAVLRDKEEVRELHRKMAEVGTQVEALKVEVEKSKKEAKQQKGLLAIAKKQLATRETERAKVEKELEEAQAEAAAATKEREEAEAEVAKEVPSPKTNGQQASITPSPDILSFAAAQPLPASPEPSTPAVSPVKSTNPFERLAMGSGPSSRSESPFLPFTGSATLPTPTVPPVSLELPVSSETNASHAEDPFGFSEAFGTSESHPSADELTEEPESHGPPPGLSAPTPGDIDIISPTDTDLFVTPPSTATIGSQSQSPVAKPEEAAETAATQFPVLDATAIASPQLPGHFPENDSHEEHTNLDTQLREIEVDESDSDDDEPLTTVKAKLTESHIETPTNGAVGHLGTSTSAFDDSFGVSTPTTEATNIPTPTRSITSIPLRSQSPALSSHSAAKDVFGSPFNPAPQQPTTPAAPAAVPALETPNQNGSAELAPEAGVSDFDETLSKIPSITSAPSSQFSQFTFDSAFDDNFDFAAATAATASVDHGASASTSIPNGGAAPTSAFPPAPVAVHAPARTDSFDAVFMSQPAASSPAPAPITVAPVTAVSPVPAPVPPPVAGSRPFSFDDAFGPGPSHPSSSLPAVQPTQSNGSIGISFDDAFGGVNASQALALDNSFASAAFQPPPGPPPTQFNATPFPSGSQPSSPLRNTHSPQSIAQRSSSPPPRAVSPPPRHSSPKPRASTGSSDKEKPPTRHSKLSIRLPFGRKKAKHDAAHQPMPPPLSQQQLVEDPTPPAEDDIEAVKQLCGMGFSRTQAVTALERHGYDVQRALNSLLGTA